MKHTIKVLYTSYLLYLFLSTIVPTTRMMDVLHLEAIPDYPVAAGQTVQLSCKNISSQIITWSRFHLQNQSWENVGSGMVLTLTEPKQSGKYRCETHNVFNVKIMSQNHTVYIVSIPTIGQFFPSSKCLTFIIARYFILTLGA